MKRPILCEMKLSEAMKYITGRAFGLPIITMSVGQWDRLLADSYDHGWILLELDGNENPVRAYKKKT